MCVMGAVPVPAVAVVVVEVAAVEELVAIFRMKSYHPLPPCNTFGFVHYQETYKRLFRSQ